MWKLSLPWWEFVVRAVVVYAFLLALLRFTGRRQVGQLAPFDLVLLLVLSNTIQNAMNAGDNSVLAGFILAVTLVTLNYLVGLATFKSRKLERMIEGRPELLIHAGHLYTEVLNREHITHEELRAALRAEGCDRIEDVLHAVLENNGHITVLTRKAPGARGPTEGVSAKPVSAVSGQPL